MVKDVVSGDWLLEPSRCRWQLAPCEACEPSDRCGVLTEATAPRSTNIVNPRGPEDGGALAFASSGRSKWF